MVDRVAHKIHSEVWDRLVSGRLPKDLGLPKHEGRVDLRGMVAPQASAGRNIRTAGREFVELTGLTECHAVTWDSADFSGSQLDFLRFYDCTIVNCVFDDCSCRDWRLWGSSFARCTFHRADLRASALGAVTKGKRNVFSDVNFAAADLRGTTYTSAEFLRCLFKNTNLKKVDFQGSVFTDCVFEGDLEEVLFYDRGFNGKDLSPNEMLRTDFSRAKFRYVEFRHLNLDTVRFPQDDDHIRLENFPQALEVLLAALNGRDDSPSRRLAAGLANKQKWLGSNQRRGVLSKRDIQNTGGEQGLQLVLRLIGDLK